MDTAPFRTLPDVATLQDEAARIVAGTLKQTADGQRVTIALSGGSTPVRMHELLAGIDGIDWSQVHVFWGDERTVPPDHDESNFRMARETLLDRVEIPSQNIHRMRGEIDPEQAANEYEQELREVFGTGRTEVPRFDIVVLGMGADGHTASLFPGTSALTERDRLAVANEVPQLDTVRITLTFPVLNAARQVLFLVAGADKADPARQAIVQDGDVPPAGFVHPEPGQLLWLLDAAAGSQLPG